MERLQVDQVLHETPEVRVVRGRLQNDTRVIAKTLLATAGPDKLAYEKRMLALMAEAQCPQIAQLIDLTDIAGRPTLITSDIGGTAVSRLGPLGTADVLHVGVQILRALVAIHDKRVAHKDINPNNIVFNPQTRAVQLIDFGIASQLKREIQVVDNLRDLEGTPHYLAPEQTGRTNYAVDYRTDLYALGATLYTLLARRPPFDDADLASLVYAIIAHEPLALSDLNRQIPKIVSQLVARLMAKSPDDRYQSARGVLTDLERIVADYGLGGAVEAFQLGEHDHDERFAIPQKLYGRSAQADVLLRTLSQCIQGNLAQLLLISGPSGIGKSSLLQTLQAIMLRDGVLYAAGKHDQLCQHVPFAALGQAFGAFVRRVLADSDTVRLTWERRLRAAVGNLGQALIDVVPLAEALLGPQKPLAELGVRETENRLLMLLQDVLRAITDHHPLVLFLDDLQWADSGTFKLIEILAQQQTLKHALLIIGAYRDGEVAPDHPLLLCVEHLTSKNLAPARVIVGSLDIEDVERLVIDTTASSPQVAQPLAEHLWHNSQGNPFFLQELLKHLYDVSVLRYDPKAQCIIWTIEEVESTGLPSGVLELVSQKLRALSADDREILCCAACLGDTFTLDLLSMASGQSRPTCYAKLQAALQAGFVTPMTSSYRYALEADRDAMFRFSHNRLREAAYALLPLDTTESLHRKIGLLLWRRFEEGTHENLFELLNHLNRSLSKVEGHDERKRIADLNLRGALEARKSAATTAAREHLTIAKKLYGDTLADFDPPTYYTLESELAMCDLLESKSESAIQRLSALLAIQPTGTAKAHTYALRAHVYYSQGNNKSTVEDSLRAMDCVGMRANLTSRGAVLFYCLRFIWSLAKHTPQTLVALPVCRNENAQFVLQILSANVTSFRSHSATAFVNTCCMAIHISLTYGKTPSLALALSAGAAFARFAGWQRTAAKLFTAAKIIVDKEESSAGISRPILESSLGSTDLNAFASAEQTALAYYDARRNGNLANACRGALSTLITMFCSNLPGYFEKRNQFLDTIRSSGPETLKAAEETRYHGARLLSGAVQSSAAFISPEAASELLVRHGLDNDTCDALLLMTLMHLAAGDYVSAYKIFQNLCKSDIWFFVLPLSLTLFSFYGVLIFHDRIRRGLQVNKSHYRLLSKMEKYLQQSAKPQHLASAGDGEYYFVAAERALAHGKADQAALFYIRACDAIETSTWTSHKALLTERVGRHFSQSGSRQLGIHYLQRAAVHYKEWGATAKSERLEYELRDILKDEVASGDAHQVGTMTRSLHGTSRTAATNLDFEAFVQAAAAISQETVPSKISERMLEAIMRLSGANRAVLMTWHANEPHDFVVQADTDPARGLPRGLLSAILRHRDVVLLADTKADETVDPYFRTASVKSALAVPLLQQTDLLGLVYLENDTLEDAFAPSRIQVAQVLAMQAVVVLANARHREQLEEEITSRTEQLRSIHAELVASERDKTEMQMAGGFAHEVRNALSGARMPLGLLVPVEARQKGHTLMEEIAKKLQMAREAAENAKIFDGATPDVRATLEAIQRDFDFTMEMMNSVVVGIERGLLITKEILNYAQAGSLVRSDEAINARQFLDAIHQEFANRWQGHSIQTYVDCPDTNLNLPMKEEHAYAILRNLLANATDALAHKEGKREIRVAVGRHEGKISLSVSDSGVGMSDDTQARVFQPFFTTKGAHGTGLGLGLSRKLARLYGGDLQFKSSEGQGASFFLTLPTEL